MKLSVAVLTYNQASYICKALDSVLMQDVDFDYEIVVGDDCSQDGTQAILHDYAENNPGRFNLLFNEVNIGISKNYQNVLKACSGEYVAILEGDDFWTDRSKLKKSVAFLENHLDYGFVGAYNTILFPNGKVEKDPYDYLPDPTMDGEWELYGDVFEYAKYGPVTRTVTICFRKSVIEPYMHYVGLGNDMVLQCVLSHNSKFAKCRDEWAVYRQGGVSNNRENYDKVMYYSQWFVENRRLQKKIFPDECDWNEDELEDQITYSQLKYAVDHLHLKEITSLRKGIRTTKYKNKKYYQISRCKFFCYILGLVKRYR